MRCISFVSNESCARLSGNTAAIAINLFFVLSKGTKNFENFQENVYDIKWVSFDDCCSLGP